MKKLTLKRLTKIMESIAGDKETVGESRNDDVIVREGSHLSAGAMFIVIIESSVLFHFLNSDYCSFELYEEYDEKLRSALDEYDVYYERYDNCVLHIYEQ